MVSFCCEIFLLCFLAVVLTFFIAGLLYLLRFERVDNLGAYRIPSETGLLIPSVCDSWGNSSRIITARWSSESIDFGLSVIGSLP
jgi:hypothetical protein